MAGRKLKWFEQLKNHDFKKYMRTETSPDIKLRFLALAHVQDGKTCRDVAKVVKVHENTVQVWVRRFAQGGRDGLKHRPGQGAKKRVNRNDFPLIKNGILSLQRNISGGRIRGKDIQQYLLETWNVAYQLSAVYALLQNLSIVWISARSKHPASSQDVQNAFKKT